MKVIVCIPARLGSTRFAGKVLANETGKYLIQHGYERACKSKSASGVIIAADDDRIVEACGEFGAECVLTSKGHKSGTDRIAEAVADLDADIVVNLQGDEPEIDPAHIDIVVELLLDNADCSMSTLVAGFESREQIEDPNIVKAILDCKGRAIYFSRSPIPYNRKMGGVGQRSDYLRHLGIYGYRKDFLLEFTKLEQSSLEKTEKLEQLRAIENGFSIIAGKVEHYCEGIDTPEQYAEFVKRYKGVDNE